MHGRSSNAFAGLALMGLLAGCGGDMAASEADTGGGSNVGFGGAQDIGQFRDLLERGEIPGEATLDANGFFSEHYAELPPPDCGDELCLHAMLAVSRDWVRRDHQAALQLAFNTPMLPEDIAETPRDLVVVVDTSGSMAADGRLDKVKAGLHLLIDEMGAEDRLGLVRYDTDASVVAELGPVSADFHELVDGLSDGGATNISGGLELGFQVLGPAPEEDRQRRVILLSDGLANEGITDNQGIFTLAEGYMEGGAGLTTIGVGNDFNTELMRGLADRGAGNFYFLEDPAAIDEVFVEELAYFTAPIAFDIRIDVAPTASYRIADVVGTSRAYGAGSSAVIEVPSVFIASRRSDDPSDDSGRRGGGSAVFVLLDAIADDGPQTAAEVSFSYRTPEGELIERSVAIENPYVPGVVPEEDYYSKEFMREHYGMLNMYLGLRDASLTAAIDYQCAADILATLRRNAAQWNEVMEDEDIAADLELVDLFLRNLETRGAFAPAEPEATSRCDGYQPASWPEDDYYHGHYHGCSAGGSGAPVGAALLVLAAAFALRRRRLGAAR